MHVHAEVLQKLQAGIGKPLRQCRQNALGRLDEMDFDVLLGVDAVEAMSNELARRVMQLRRELRASCAGTYDGDVELFWAPGLNLRVAADIGIHQPRVEALSIDRRI